MAQYKVQEEFQRELFQTLVHYICAKCADPSVLGAVKLNKILWMSDLFSYLNYGKTITGEKYVKAQYGPRSTHVLDAIAALESDRVLVEREVMLYYPTKQYISLSNPDISRFSAQEISVIDDVISYVCYQHTATSISELSHNVMWDSVEFGQEIQFYTVLTATLGEVTDDDIEWAREKYRSRSNVVVT